MLIRRSFALQPRPVQKPNVRGRLERWERILYTAAFAVLVSASLDAAPTGLVHHWALDEGPDWHDDPFQSPGTNSVAIDSVGNADATLQNLSGTNWVSGRQFTALEFDGVRDYLSVATNLATTLGETASLSFWIRTLQRGPQTPAGAPGVTGAEGTGGAQWGWLDADGRIGMSVDGVSVARSSSIVSDGQWHHVVLTRDSATGTGQVYVDGGLSAKSSGTSGSRWVPFRSLGRIEGGLGGGAPTFLRGRLDQIHAFNRVLDAADVAMLHTNHAPKLWETVAEGVGGRSFTTASVFSRAYDVERDPLTVARWTDPAHGAIQYNGDGSFNYRAADGFLGNDRFLVTVEDGRGGFRTVGVNVVVMKEAAGGGGIPVTQFQGFARIEANGQAISHSGWRVPRAVDWNGDGRVDLLLGAGGSVWIYLNTGTPQTPEFGAGNRVRAAGVNVTSGTDTSPIAFLDMTGDGIPDLVLADSSRKLRVYRNTAPVGQPPELAAFVRVRNASGGEFILPDRRFDLGDWDGDGKPDLVTGTFSGSMQLFTQIGTLADPRFGTGTDLTSESYNLYPRLVDLDGNGRTDFLRSINWGDILYWRDAGQRGLVSPVTLSLTDANGTNPDLHALTDGAMVDFGDFNGDGKADLVVGGHAGNGLYLAFGVRQSITESLAAIEAIYDAHPTDLGVALSANGDELLREVNRENLNLISYLRNGTLSTRETLFEALSAHVRKYAFLKYQTLDTQRFHHVPSLVVQNWVMLHYLLADTPARRVLIADTLGLTGTARTVYLETGLAIGDNAQSIPAAYGTIRDLQRRHPRELFPDAVLTIDQFYGDNRGGFIWTPNSAKNTFGDWAVGPANEWAGDLTDAIERVLGGGAATGDYFTFVMGHEVTHSLDGYVNSRANRDLRRRWGLMLCAAAGPDIIPGADGWWDWAATKARFRAQGYWDGTEATWDASWATYWATGYGASFKDLSFMRFDISFFISAPQESLATQANHHWANGPGRLIGAVDRFRRATTTGLPPLRANINEVVTFIDFLSAGMNRVNLVETKFQAVPKQVNWFDHYADLERDDRGYIQRISVNGTTYQLESNADGVVTNVTTSLLLPQGDSVWTFRNQPRQFEVLSNDSRLEGGPVRLAGVGQPERGSVIAGAGADGTLIYTPPAGQVGTDRFTYTVTSAAGGTAMATVNVEIVDAAAANGSMRVEYWNAIGAGTAVRDLTENPRFPDRPSVAYSTNSGFELRRNVGDSFGARVRTRLVPQASGDYTFWIASDDSSELWLSPNTAAGGRSLIASVSGWTDPRQWTKFPSQKSALIPLIAGQAYDLEALQKEGTGGDHLSVAWQGPSPDTTRRVIAAADLRHPFAGFEPPVFTSNPLLLPDARVGVPYTGSLAGSATDANAGEILAYSKIGRPEWLTIASDGTLSGTPSASDAGLQGIRVQAIDPAGFVGETVLQLRVNTTAEAPQLTLSSSAAGVALEMIGTVGLAYRIEAATQLADLKWETLLEIPSLPQSPHRIPIPTATAPMFLRAIAQ